MGDTITARYLKRSTRARELRLIAREAEQEFAAIRAEWSHYMDEDAEPAWAASLDDLRGFDDVSLNGKRCDDVYDDRDDYLYDDPWANSPWDDDPYGMAGDWHYASPTYGAQVEASHV